VGTLAGLSGAPTVLWLDAHGDFNTPETTASGFLDGMALAVIAGRCWANLARTVPGFRPVPEHDVVLLGARELDTAERLLLDGSEIARLSPEQVPADLSPVLAKWSGREAYVHLDLDALDPVAGRANALAAPGGSSVEEMCAALEQIGRTLRVQAVALTAYDPLCGSEGRICRAAFRLLNALLGAMAHPAAQQTLADDEPAAMFS
jgi:arginase